jgi:hypothetical protein
MRVRVFDMSTNTYFSSEVYAIINPGWYEKQLVLVPSPNGSYMKFFDCLNKSSNNSFPKALTNTVMYAHPKD